MKKHFLCGFLLAIVPCISLSSSSLTLKKKDTRPITEPPRSTTQALLAAIQTTLWLWLLARLNYLNDKRRQDSRWGFDDLALPRAIKDNALRLWATACKDLTPWHFFDLDFELWHTTFTRQYIAL